MKGFTEKNGHFFILLCATLANMEAARKPIKSVIAVYVICGYFLNEMCLKGVPNCTKA